MKTGYFKPFLLILLLSFFAAAVFAQSGQIRGNVKDKTTGEGIPFANIVLLKDKTVIQAGVSDLDGNYKLVVAPGKYDLKVTYIGYLTFMVKGVTIRKDSLTKVNASLEVEVKKLDELVIVENHADYDMGTITTEGYDEMPSPSPTMEKRSEGEFMPYRGSTFKTKSYGTDDGGYNGAKSGLLTAGEVSDFSKWKLWQGIADNQLAEYQKYWQFKPTERYTVQVMNDNNKGIIGCEVKLVSSKGITVWTGRTDNTGKVELWSNMFKEEYSTSENFSIVASWHGDFKTLANAKKFHDGINMLKFNAPCDNPNKLDVVFMVDATGSMGDEINYLKAELNDIMEKVKDAHKDLEVKTGAVFYRDVVDSYVTVKSDLTSDLDKTIKFIKNQSAGGGGDFPEAVDRGLDTSVFGISWDKEARTKLLFMVLDAPPHYSPEIQKKLHDATMKAAEMGIRIIPIAASGIDKSTEYLMRAFALATNGTYVFLTDDSGIGGSHIKPTTDKFEVETLNALLLRLFFQYTSAPSCDEVITTKMKSDTTIVLGKDTAKDTLTVKTKVLPTGPQTQTTIDSLKNITHLVSMKCYPNPTSGQVFVEIKGTVKEVFLADVSGKLLRRFDTEGKEKMEIDLSDLSAGIYFIQCLENERWKAGKIVLVR